MEEEFFTKLYFPLILNSINERLSLEKPSFLKYLLNRNALSKQASPDSKYFKPDWEFSLSHHTHTVSFKNPILFFFLQDLKIDHNRGLWRVFQNYN